ncbi:hypothetical protein YC2023_028596 [Brassica napus]
MGLEMLSNTHATKCCAVSDRLDNLSLRNLDSDSKRIISLLWRTNKDTRIEMHWI